MCYMQNTLRLLLACFKNHTFILLLVLFMCNHPTCNFFAYYYQQLFLGFSTKKVKMKKDNIKETRCSPLKMHSTRWDLFWMNLNPMSVWKGPDVLHIPTKNNPNLPFSECEMSCSLACVACVHICTAFNAAEGFSPQAESTEPGCPCRGVVCKWSGLEDLLSVAGYAVSVISNDCRDLWWNSFFPFYVLSHLKNRGRVETSDMANHNLLLMQIYYSTFKNGKDEMKNLHQMYDNSRPHLLMMEHRGGY